MAKSNFIVRGGADFSGIKKEIQKTQQQMSSFQSTVNNSMSMIGKAFKIGLGYISARAIAGFVKETTKLGSDVAEIQNVVNVTFGSMTKDIEEFTKTAMDNFGLGELSAKKYASYMGAMLKSSGIAGQQMKEMSIDLTKLTADMASFYNLDNDEMFKKLMSGMSGATMPLKQLGINMNIANLEAFALSQGIKKSWQEMSQAEQTMLRYNYLLSVTGDMQGDFSRNAHNWGHQLKILSEQWNTLKATIGQGFINILAPIITGFNILIKKIQVAAEYFRAFTALIFGNTQASRKTAGNLGYAADALNDVGGVAGDADKSLGKAGKGLGKAGKAAKKAGKDMKGAIAGFDEINQLTEKMANPDTSGGGAGGLGDVGTLDFGSIESTEVDLGLGKAEEDILRLKNVIKDFYNNWGSKDIFVGIKAGAALVNFDAIKENFKITFTGWGEIARTALDGLQPIFKSSGEVLGTMFKYGIASIGNIFEPISLGFANFTINMKGPIQEWIMETSSTITNGFKNLNTIFEIIGGSWLNSINKYKPQIAKSTEDTLTNVSKTYMLIGTVTSDTFEIITEKIKDFITRNKKDIGKFMDSILQIFTDVWGLINTVWTDTLDSLKAFWDTWGKDILSRVMNVVTQIGEWFLYLWNDLVKPIWDAMLEWMKKIWNDSLRDIVTELLEFVGRVGDLILRLWEGILQPLLDKLIKFFTPIFRETFIFALDIVGSVVDGIGTVIKGLLKTFNGLIDFIVGVFTGDWRKAWEGVRNIFKGIFDSLYGFVKAPLNMIISAINTVIRGLNKLSIDIPDWVPGFGGKTWGINIPSIPKLAKGGIIDKPTIAMVGEAGKEVVMPLENNTGWIDKLAGQIATGMMGVMQFSNNEKSSGDIILQIDGTTFARIIGPVMDREKGRVGNTVIQSI